MKIDSGIQYPKSLQIWNLWAFKSVLVWAMVSLKTPDSPVEKKTHWLRHNGGVHQLLGTQSGIPVNEAENGQKSKQNWRGLRSTQTDENPAQETGQVGGQEEEEEENAAGVTEVEEDESFSFLKGHQDAKNPGEVGNWEPAVSFR